MKKNKFTTGGIVLRNRKSLINDCETLMSTTQYYALLRAMGRNETEIWAIKLGHSKYELCLNEFYSTNLSRNELEEIISNLSIKRKKKLDLIKKHRGWINAGEILKELLKTEENE